MSKTYKEITPVEALKRLAEAGKPIGNLVFKDKRDDGYNCMESRTLIGVCVVAEDGNRIFRTALPTGDEVFTAWWDQCAEVIEEDPKPWTFETCPRERCWLRRSTGGTVEYLLSSVRKTSVAASGYGDIGLQTLASEWQHSLDNGKTWLPCTQ